MDLRELILDETQMKFGVEAVSVVENPAIESNFIALSKTQIEFAEVNKEKRILLGAALIPDKPILRLDKKTKEEYHVYFSKDTIRQVMELFAKNKFQDKATFEHQRPIEGMTIVESWIVEDEEKDKSAFYGLNVPKGTWMISMKADNEEIYNLAKEGKVKGFSIEGFFSDGTEEDEETKILREIAKQLNIN